MIELSLQQKQAIADALEGSSGIYDNSICEQHGIDIVELEELAESLDVVRCVVCGWWVSRDETVPFDDGFSCEDCVE